jgi:hypothetical protein
MRLQVAHCSGHKVPRMEQPGNPLPHQALFQFLRAPRSSVELLYHVAAQAPLMERVKVFQNFENARRWDRELPFGTKRRKVYSSSLQFEIQIKASLQVKCIAYMYSSQ